MGQHRSARCVAHIGLVMPSASADVRVRGLNMPLIHEAPACPVKLGEEHRRCSG